MIDRELLDDPIQSCFPAGYSPIGIYIHIPFCSGRCNYCGFVSNLHDRALEEIYTQAVLREMELWSLLDH